MILWYMIKVVWGYSVINYNGEMESGTLGDFDCDVIKLMHSMRLITVLLWYYNIRD